MFKWRGTWSVPSKGKLLTAFIVFMAGHSSPGQGVGGHGVEERPKSGEPAFWIQLRPRSHSLHTHPFPFVGLSFHVFKMGVEPH